MSHLSKCRCKVTDMATAQRIAMGMNWTWMERDLFTAKFGQKLKDCTEFQNNGQTKCVIDSTGDIHVDAYYMGYDYQKFVQDYSIETIKNNMAGGMLQEQTVAPNGDVILRVAYM